GESWREGDAGPSGPAARGTGDNLSRKQALMTGLAASLGAAPFDRLRASAAPLPEYRHHTHIHRGRKPMPSLDGKIAVITGSGSGIGRSAALMFAREGATVVLVGRRKQ